MPCTFPSMPKGTPTINAPGCQQVIKASTSFHTGSPVFAFNVVNACPVLVTVSPTATPTCYNPKSNPNTVTSSISACPTSQDKRLKSTPTHAAALYHLTKALPEAPVWLVVKISNNVVSLNGAI